MTENYIIIITTTTSVDSNAVLLLPYSIWITCFILWSSWFFRLGTVQQKRFCPCFLCITNRHIVANKMVWKSFSSASSLLPILTKTKCSHPHAFEWQSSIQFMYQKMSASLWSKGLSMEVCCNENLHFLGRTPQNPVSASCQMLNSGFI